MPIDSCGEEYKYYRNREFRKLRVCGTLVGTVKFYNYWVGPAFYDFFSGCCKKIAVRALLQKNWRGTDRGNRSITNGCRNKRSPESSLNQPQKMWSFSDRQNYERDQSKCWRISVDGPPGVQIKCWRDIDIQLRWFFDIRKTRLNCRPLRTS